MNKNLIPLLSTIILTFVWSATTAFGATNEELAKETQNPVADLIHVSWMGCLRALIH